MVEKEQPTQISYLVSDFNTRLNDLEERNKIVRERVLLLGQNLISIKEDSDKGIEGLRRQVTIMQKDIEKLKLLNQNIVSEMNRFVNKDEVLIIERMLRDFQPLQFVRMKDVEDLINKRLNPRQDFTQPEKQENIKTKKSTNDNIK
jgi:hypothetical protein